MRKNKFRRGFETLEDRTMLATFMVTNTLDSGLGSLRRAILQANTALEPSTILFEIPTNDPNFIDVDAARGGDPDGDVWVIRPTSQLPAINNRNPHPQNPIRADDRNISKMISIVGPTGNSFNPNGPEIVIDGTNAGAGVDGLTVLSDEVGIYNLAINNFGGAGIRISAAVRTGIERNHIGIDPAGSRAAANQNGIDLSNGSFRAFLFDNVISGNRQSGIQILGLNTDQTLILNNRIGVDRSGAAAVQNGDAGINIGQQAKFNGAVGNVISGNGTAGIEISGVGTDGNEIRSNRIGLSASSQFAVGNRGPGISIRDNAQRTFVGIRNPENEGPNQIAGNLNVGIRVESLDATSSSISQNVIGQNESGDPIPNQAGEVSVLLPAPPELLSYFSEFADGIENTNTIVANGNVQTGSSTGAVVRPAPSNDEVKRLIVPAYFEINKGNPWQQTTDAHVQRESEVLAIANVGKGVTSYELFDVTPSTQSLVAQLNGTTVPSSIRQAFVNFGLPLTREPTVVVVESGVEWEIRDSRTYVLRNENGSIVIYEGVTGGPLIPKGFDIPITETFYRNVLVDSYVKGVKVVGYVSTKWGSRPIDDVLADIDSWKRDWPGISGVFLDEQTTGCSTHCFMQAEPAPRLALEKLDYYEQIRAHTITVFGDTSNPAGDPRVVTNPGTFGETPDDLEFYLGDNDSVTVADIMLIHEKTELETLIMPDWAENYSPGRFAALAHQIPEWNLEVGRQIGPVGSFFITDDGADGNPWNSLPAYWTEMVGFVAEQNNLVDREILTVSNTNDSGEGSLRKAIELANVIPGENSIVFNIPGAGSVHTIRPQSPLPTIIESVTIDGYSQAGSARASQTPDRLPRPTIELDGSIAGASNGLVVDASNVSIKGLAINGFQRSGIAIQGEGSSQSTVQGNVIGLNAADLGSAPNSLFEIHVSNNATVNSIGGLSTDAKNIIGGRSAAVRIESGLGNSIRRNHFLGFDRAMIDLGDLGVTLNDSDDRDRGPNNLQNYPVLRRAIAPRGQNDGTLVTYALPTRSQSAVYPIEVDLYQVGADARSTTTYLGSISIARPQNEFTIETLNADISANTQIVAMATDAAGNSSEFSPPILVQSPINADSGEPRNNSRSQAIVVGNSCTSGQLSRQGSIHTLGDADYFGFTFDCPGTLIATLDFEHDLGDLDLELYGSQTTPHTLVTSTGRGDLERIAFPISASPENPQTVYVRVLGYHGDVNPQYDLNVQLSKNDKDGDGLLDEWERMQGIDVDGDGIIDVPLPGANEFHKDLYVEVDFMQGRGPTPLPAATSIEQLYPGSPTGVNLPESVPRTNTSLDMVVEAFARAPVPNEDGQTGINLHLTIDAQDSIPVESFSTWNDFVALRQTKFGTPAERAGQKWRDVQLAKRNVYRYVLFADSLEGTERFGRSSINSNDFVITLGDTFNDESLPYVQAGVFMHELGHTLGLEHGGGDDINFKPNYISVMNYLWTVPRPETEGWRLDYSRFKLDTLNRKELNESKGIACDRERPELREHYRNVRVPVGPIRRQGPNKFHQVPVLSCSVDWNGDGDQLDGTQQSDLAADVTRLIWDANADGFVSKADEFAGGESFDVLEGFNDWENIRFQFTYSDVVKFGDVIDLVELASEDGRREKPSLVFDEDWFDNDKKNNDDKENASLFEDIPRSAFDDIGFIDLYDILFAEDLDSENDFGLSIASASGIGDHDWFKLVLPFSGNLNYRFEATQTRSDLGLGFQIVNPDQAGTVHLDVTLHEGDFVTSSLPIDSQIVSECAPSADVSSCNGHFFHAFGVSDEDTTEIGLYRVGFQLEIGMDVENVERLQQAIRSWQESEQHQLLRFDLSRDRILSFDDLEILVSDRLNTYFGDSDLNGQFDSGDLIQIFAAGEYEDDIVGNSTWSTGDWNGDGEFDTSDLIVGFTYGGYDRGPRPAVPIRPNQIVDFENAGLPIEMDQDETARINRIRAALVDLEHGAKHVNGKAEPNINEDEIAQAEKGYKRRLDSVAAIEWLFSGDR